MKRFACVLAMAGSLSVMACGGDSAAKSKAPEFSIFPRTIYTGFDGQHTYKAPVIAVSADEKQVLTGDVTWTLADPSLADVKVEAAGATLTAKKAGDTTLTATQLGKSFTAKVKIYAYTPQAYAEGEHRYTTKVDDNNPACNNCHGKGAGKGPDHTPTELDADPDDEIQNTFTTGVDPEGRPIAKESEWAYLLEGKMHMWSVTPSEKMNMLAYLRALEPTGYPEYDAPTDE
jgi:mono/diheme cytochrome c family protein